MGHAVPTNYSAPFGEGTEYSAAGWAQILEVYGYYGLSANQWWTYLCRNCVNRLEFGQPQRNRNETQWQATFPDISAFPASLLKNTLHSLTQNFSSLL